MKHARENHRDCTLNVKAIDRGLAAQPLGRTAIALVALAVAAVHGGRVEAAEQTKAAPMAARAEAADSSMPARVQSLTVELRQYYLQPLSSGRGLFQGWNRDGRGGNATRGATDVVLEDAAGAGSTSEEWMDRIERRLDQEGLGLRSASLRRKPTLIDRGIDAVFMPEPIKLGRTQLAFSPYTAIKRRNPLCLLNPIPLAVSW